MSYLVVGGNPFTNYKNVIVYTAIRKIGLVETYEEAVKLVEANYEECAGLIEVFNTETGDPAE